MTGLYGVKVETEDHTANCVDHVIMSQEENLALDYDTNKAWDAAHREDSYWVELGRRVRDAIETGFFTCNC